MDIDFNSQASKVMKALSKGVFLSTSANESNNVMTIGWGSIGYIWGKPVFMAMVRPSRYSIDLIENTSEFAVSIPAEGTLKEALAYCGAKSGRDVNKITATGLSYVPGRTISVPVISGCSLYYECKVIYKQIMDLTTANEDVLKWYPDKEDKHILYYGEILACYQGE